MLLFVVFILVEQVQFNSSPCTLSGVMQFYGMAIFLGCNCADQLTISFDVSVCALRIVVCDAFEHHCELQRQ